jgi:hypothetical protein
MKTDCNFRAAWRCNRQQASSHAFQTARASIRVPALSRKEQGFQFGNASEHLNAVRCLMTRFAAIYEMSQQQPGKPRLVVANQAVLVQQIRRDVAHLHTI